MATAKVKKIDMGGVSKKIERLKQNSSLGKFLAEQAAKGMDGYVPYRDGHLSKSYKSSPFKVTYIAPYAHYIWNGISKSRKELNISKQGHPKATSHWEESYASAHGEELGRSATEYVKRL